ncbi:MAG TPA: hypothetical protein VFU43_03975 [Streptosporangiaceae bacterium]|nr:hypothetical protein [Streptosporangiaceae bacterium]
MSDNEYIWPARHHDLQSAADEYWSFSDLGWQRHHHGLFGRIFGFRRAAEMLYEAMLASHSIADLDTVFYPYAMCWRHHVELQLKTIHAQLRAIGGLPTQSHHHHKIQQLWRECRKLLIEHFPNESKADLNATDRVLRQLADMDPDGQEFRYASRRDGSATLPKVDRINLVSFHEAMLAIANYLDAVHSSVGEYLAAKQEMDAYYRAGPLQ